MDRDKRREIIRAAAERMADQWRTESTVRDLSLLAPYENISTAAMQEAVEAHIERTSYPDELIERLQGSIERCIDE